MKMAATSQPVARPFSGDETVRWSCRRGEYVLLPRLMSGDGCEPVVAKDGWFWHHPFMSTLMEIEQAAVKLPAEEQKRLLRFLLRVLPVNEAELPEPRVFSDEEIQGWLAEDEASMRRLREGP